MSRGGNSQGQGSGAGKGPGDNSDKGAGKGPGDGGSSGGTGPGRQDHSTRPQKRARRVAVVFLAVIFLLEDYVWRVGQR